MEVKPGYKMTEVGVIPTDWDVRPLLSTVRIANGQVDPKAEPYRSMVLVAPDHIESGSGRLLKKETAAEQHSISGKYLFKRGDLVYSKIRPYLRKAILADFDGLCSADMYPLKPASDISAGFVFAIILGQHFSSYAESVSVRSGMPKINRTELSAYSFPLPSKLAEQEVIAGALSDADALIESLEQLISKKRQIKQGMMQELLTGKKRLPGFTEESGFKQTDIGVIPKDWEVRKVSELVRYGPRNGYSGKSGNVVNGTPTLSLAATTSGKLVLNQETIKYLEIRIPSESDLFLKPDDVLVQRSNTVDLVGTTAIYSGPKNTYIYPDLMMRLRFSDSVTAQWFWRYSNSSSGRRYFVSVAAGSTGSMPKISGDKLREMPIPLPPTKAEKEKIADILSDMDAEISKLETKLAKARLVKAGMMQELLTGRTRLV